MKIPPYLKKGDKIAIVATARAIEKKYIAAAVSELESWGLEVVLGKNIFNTHFRYAGTDEERSNDLQTALDDTSVNAIIIARGGYGTARIIDSIDFTTFVQHPKWIVGFSDITVLHGHINALGIASLHATMPINFDSETDTVESMKAALFGEGISYTIPSHSFNRNGEALAELVGGNLSVYCSLLGSKSEVDTTGKILFIEDVDEYVYHIDRMMISLKRANKLAGLKGLIVGQFTDMKDNTDPFGKSIEEIIRDAVKEYDFPVCFNFPSGHVSRNLALPFGKEMKLEVNSSGVLLKG